MTAPATLDRITDFPALVRYLRDELEWEIPDDAAFGDLTFNWTPSEIGLDLNEPIEITQLRPLRADQRWGVFFLNFPHGKLPVTLMRRILRGLSKRKRASANAADKAAWDKDDLIFISAVGDADDRRLSFAHFQERGNDLPTLRVIGWDKDDTVRRLSHTNQVLRSKLGWRHGKGLPLNWRDAFTERPRESVRTSKEMAEALAGLARDIRDRIKLIMPTERSSGDLKQLFEAVKQTLSKDLDTDKFADTYAQTIAYGLLSARINQVRERDAKHEAAQKVQLGPKPELPEITADAAGKAMPTTNPFLRELFGSFLSAGGRDGEGSGLDFDELGIGEVVDLLNVADIEAVLLDFDKHKAGDDPVIHFYEGFLHAYDKALKVQRGVFYTPRPVVSFIVRAVDEVLRTDFGLEDGLADTTTWAEFIASHPEAKIPDGVKGDEPFVKILDPATGTGTFLVEVIELIHDRLVAKWRKAGLNDEARLKAWNAWVPQHLLPRLYGFELMMAPYAVAHMKIGLKLADTGYQFEGVDADGKPARARVFLTNALEPAHDLDMQLAFMSEAMAHEAKAANEAKGTRFTVVLGNPPYAGHSSNPSRDARGKLTTVGEMIRPFFFVDGVPLGEKNPKWLNNDYVKFIRLSQLYIDRASVGVLGFITSNSWLESPTFRGVRASLLSSFNKIWIVDCHGHIKKREKLPDGSADQGVFEIEEGTAILVGSLLADETAVRRGDLLGSANSKFDRLRNARLELASKPLSPKPPTYSLLLQAGSVSDYDELFPLPVLYPHASLGVLTKRDNLVVGMSQAETLSNIREFVSAGLRDDDVADRFNLPLTDNDTWNLSAARRQIGSPSVDKIKDLMYRPFDSRYIYYDKVVVARPNSRVMSALDQGQSNLALVVGRQGAATGGEQWNVCFATAVMPDQNIFRRGGGTVFPLWSPPQGTEDRTLPNIALAFVSRVAALTGLVWDDCVERSKQGALAGVIAPEPVQTAMFATRRERGEPGRSFGPRDLFDWIYAALHSPAYRARYADFLKSDFARIPVPKNRALFVDLIPLGTELVSLHLLDPVTAPILADPAVRFVNPDGVEARLDGRKADARRNAAGRVYVNDGCWFETVPASAWGHWIGGYQPAQKWVKDRAAKGGKRKSEGCVLTPEDQLHYRRMITALGRTAELMAEIDVVIAKHGGWPEAFRGMAD